MKRLTDPAQGYCEMYCENYGIPGCEPETCARKSEVAMYERLKDVEGIVLFERLVELAFADRDGRCVVLPSAKKKDKESFFDALSEAVSSWGDMSKGEKKLSEAILDALRGEHDG